MPIRSGGSKDNSGPLDIRLAALEAKKFKINEMFNIIKDFLLSPIMAEMIETNNTMHYIHTIKGGPLALWREKARKSGFWYNFCKFFNPWEHVLDIQYQSHLFICKYSKYSYFSLVTRIKDEYDKKLEASFGCKFVILDKGK